MKRLLHLIAALTLFAGLNSCKVGPDYRTPCVPAPAEWASSEFAPLEQSTEDLATWWEVFDDPQLSAYIALGAANNNEVQIALLNICRARAAKTAAASKLFPTLEGGNTYSRNSFDLFSTGGIGGGTTTMLEELQSDTGMQIFFAGVDALWEIDLFGKTRREVEAACARIGSARENYRHVLVTVCAEIASLYLEARGLQAEVQVVQEQLDLFDHEIHLQQVKYGSGLADTLQLKGLFAQKFRSQADLIALQKEMYGRIYALSVLIGWPPADLLQEMAGPKPLPALPFAVNAGVPAELLRRRPDVRQAERELAAATAEIGVSVAKLFPNLSLGGSAGYQRFITPLSDTDSSVWSYSVRAFQPLYNAGRNIAAVKDSKAYALQAYFQYKDQVLRAIAEADKALMVYAKELERAEALQNDYAKEKEITALQEKLFASGIDDRMALLEKQRAALSVKLQLAAARTAAASSLPQLYKSLGGGW